MPSSLTITGMSASLPLGEEILGPLTITNSAASGVVLALALTQGDNTVAIPSTSTAFVVYQGTVGGIPGAATLSIRYSTNSGDAGFPISNAAFSGPFSLPTPLPTSLIIHASDAQASPPLCVWFN